MVLVVSLSGSWILPISAGVGRRHLWTYRRNARTNRGNFHGIQMLTRRGILHESLVSIHRRIRGQRTEREAR